MEAASSEGPADRKIVAVLDDDLLNRIQPMRSAVETTLPDVTFHSCSTVDETVSLIEAKGHEILVLSLDYDLGDDGAFQNGRRVRPTFSGMDVVRYLQARKPEFDVIVHSASREASLMCEELISAGYITVLATPAAYREPEVPDVWLAAVQDVVRRAQMGREGALR